VPTEPLSNTQHPSKALGIAHVRILADEKAITFLVGQLTSIFGSEPITSTLTESIWVLDTPTQASSSCGEIGTGGPELIVTTPKDKDEFGKLKKSGPGIYEIAFWVEKSRSSSSERTPYGKIVWCPDS
jgi:hypothetical protein